MVPAEIAGVICTADPRSGNSDHLVLNATWGLGEGVVQGVVTPDHWMIDRASGQIHAQQLGEKEHMIVIAPGSGTTVVATPTAQRTTLTLTPARVETLGTLALAVEKHFGAPQDIEWAYAQDCFWLLQARPLTTDTASDKHMELDSDTAPDTIWTAANIQEVLPGLLPPLSWSLLQGYLNYGLRKTFLETATLTDPDIEFLAYFYHRPFLNVSALRHIATRAPGTSPAAVDEQYLGRARDRHALPPQWSLRQLLVYASTAPWSLWLLYRTPHRVCTVAARLRPWLDQHRHQDMSQLTRTALLDLFEQAHEISYQLAALHIATTSGASATFETLHRLLRAWCGDTAQDLMAHLTTGLREVASASPSRELAALAALVRNDDTLHAALLDADPWRRLHDLQGPAATTLRARLEQFLAVHGHRGVKEFDIAARTWAEDPHSVLVLLRNLLALPPAKSEQVTPEVQRMTTTRAIAQRLVLPQRLVFRTVLRWTQTYIMLREHTKSLWVEVHHLLRRLFRDVGHRLTMQGVLAAPDEVYFLTMTELQPFLMTGTTAVDLSAIIRRRHVAFARHQHLQLPETFQGRPQPLPPTPPVATARVLHGIPVSPGVVTGPARIVMDPRQEATIFPGEILVTPVTDTGWTPLFLVAAGLVVDVGGPLSHGAIVAREYGVPTVVNVKGATRVFRTGEMLTLNGSTGEVWG
jgi:pyruvate,water dikinase